MQSLCCWFLLHVSMYVVCILEMNWKSVGKSTLLTSILILQSVRLLKVDKTVNLETIKSCYL